MLLSNYLAASWTALSATPWENNTMSRTLSFFTAAGAAAEDMSVIIVGEWVRTPIDDPVSFQLAWDGAATGTWTIEGTNRPNPEVTETQVDTYPSASYSGDPSQPAGAAGSTTIKITACNAYHRPKFTPSSGGTGVVATCDAAGKGW
jgi:hypothetical protein